MGLLTLTEVVDSARRISQAVEVPAISDAGTGYGNQINVVRTVAEFERTESRRSTSRIRYCRRSAGT